MDHSVWPFLISTYSHTLYTFVVKSFSCVLFSFFLCVAYELRSLNACQAYGHFVVVAYLLLVGFFSLCVCMKYNSVWNQSIRIVEMQPDNGYLWSFLFRDRVVISVFFLMISMTNKWKTYIFVVYAFVQCHWFFIYACGKESAKVGYTHSDRNAKFRYRKSKQSESRSCSRNQSTEQALLMLSTMIRRGSKKNWVELRWSNLMYWIRNNAHTEPSASVRSLHSFYKEIKMISYNSKCMFHSINLFTLLSSELMLAKLEQNILDQKNSKQTHFF